MIYDYINYNVSKNFWLSCKCNKKGAIFWSIKSLLSSIIAINF